jgi:hypothetical protein
MILKTKLHTISELISTGDILIFSESKAFLIIEDNHNTKVTYCATQIFNNGNEKLGFVNYSNYSIDLLYYSLKKDYGVPLKIIPISRVSIELDKSE